MDTYGYSYGYGNGNGYGYGYGNGNGNGDGDGYGNGNGYGNGGDYWPALIETFSANWSSQQLSRLKECQSQGAFVAYWASDKDGFPTHGGSLSTAASMGRIEEIPGPLQICKNALHATMCPSKWPAARLWIVALHGEVVRQEDKAGALKREILGEVTLKGGKE